MYIYIIQQDGRKIENIAIKQLLTAAGHRYSFMARKLDHKTYTFPQLKMSFYITRKQY